MLVSEVAAELKVSIFSVIDHNGNIGLEPSSPLRKGTTLWRPGPRPAGWVEPFLPAVLDEEDDEDNSLWDEDAGSEGDSDGDGDIPEGVQVRDIGIVSARCTCNLIHMSVASWFWPHRLGFRACLDARTHVF